MPRVYKRKKPVPPRPYHEAVAACKVHLESGTSVRGAAKREGINEKTLRRHLKKEKEGEVLMVRGQPTSLPLACEKELSLMLTIQAKWGFAYSYEEVADRVQEFIKDAKERQTAEAPYLQQYVKFKVRIAIATYIYI